MTTTTHIDDAVPAFPSSTLGVKITMALGGAVFLLMMLLGLSMKLAQGNIIELDPILFYQVMTAHGIGMVGAAGLTGAAIMWFYVSRYASLMGAVFWIFLGLFLTGVVFILGAIFAGGFAAAWTFLYPLPAISGGFWDVQAAAAHLVGLILIGVGFLLLHLEVGRGIMSEYGSLAKAMALPLLFTGKQKDVPPPAIVAATATTIFNAIGLVPGASILIISLVNLLYPAFAIDALLAKNMIFFFGHVFINASIYMAVMAVYEIMPLYTGRPWNTSRVFAGAWLAILFMVMAVYPHHLLQDTVMPAWMLVMGQVVSYMSGIPVIAVTAFSLLAMIYRSGIRWDLSSALLTAGVFGWAVGSVPGIIDATISVNKVMHNTLWVPGHFHMYLLLGQVVMAFGFMAWLTRTEKAEDLTGFSLWAFIAYFIGSVGFVLMFLVAGAASVPRRWAVHLPEWVIYDQIGSLFAAIVILGALAFVTRFVARLLTSSKA